jgi:hypothetical protein
MRMVRRSRGCILLDVDIGEMDAPAADRIQQEIPSPLSL